MDDNEYCRPLAASTATTRRCAGKTFVLKVDVIFIFTASRNGVCKFSSFAALRLLDQHFFPEGGGSHWRDHFLRLRDRPSAVHSAAWAFICGEVPSLTRSGRVVGPRVYDSYISVCSRCRRFSSANLLLLFSFTSQPLHVAHSAPRNRVRRAARVGVGGGIAQPRVAFLPRRGGGLGRRSLPARWRVRVHRWNAPGAQPARQEG